MPAKSKACRSCGKTKPLSDFYKRRDSTDGHRSNCKRCYVNQQSKPSEIRPASGGRLPIAPFRSWLEGRLEYHGSVTDLAKATGMHERQIFRVLKQDQEKIALDTVDRALVNEQSTHLWQLDYSEEDFAQAAYEQERTESKRK